MPFLFPSCRYVKKTSPQQEKFKEYSIEKRKTLDVKTIQDGRNQQMGSKTEKNT